MASERLGDPVQHRGKRRGRLTATSQTAAAIHRPGRGLLNASCGFWMKALNQHLP